MRANAIQLRLKAGPHYERYVAGVAAKIGATLPGEVEL